MAKKEEPNFQPVPVTVRLKSLSPYSQSKMYEEPKQKNETDEDRDIRCWKLHAHTGKDGTMIIPPMGFKKALVSASKLMNEKIPGAGNQTYSKQFECGVLLMNPLDTGVKEDSWQCEAIWADSQGKRGGGSRVRRRYPTIQAWDGELTFYVTSPKITPEVFRKYLEAAGFMIGVGRFRAENGGYYGRFEIEDMKWGK